jgi:SAM-dependent methyltransferase
MTLSMQEVLTRGLDHLPRRLEVMAHGALNQANGVSAQLRRRQEGAGMDGVDSRIDNSLAYFAPAVSLLTSPSGTTGWNILELGPGRTPHFAAAFALCGAASVVGLDIAASVDSTEFRSPDRYRALARSLSEGKASSLREALGASSETVRARVESSEPLPIAFGSFDGDNVPLPTASIDLIVSWSTLEHVRNECIDPLLAELRRVLRPGGGMAHWIDIRDHFRIIGFLTAEGDWLRALRYSDTDYERMFSKRPIYVNRLRSSEWHERFQNAGFAVRGWNEHRLPFAPDFDRSAIDPRWRNLPNDELEVSVIEASLSAPG